MVELPSEPLSHNPTDSYLMLVGVITSTMLLYMLYMLAFIAMMLIIIRIVNCGFNHLMYRPHIVE